MFVCFFFQCISPSEIYKYANENELGIDVLLTQYQRTAYGTKKNQIEITEFNVCLFFCYFFQFCFISLIFFTFCIFFLKL